MYKNNAHEATPTHENCSHSTVTFCTVKKCTNRCTLKSKTFMMNDKSEASKIWSQLFDQPGHSAK